MILLLSSTAVLVDGVPLGAPEQAIAARPDLAFPIASAMLVFDRQQRAADNADALCILTGARNDALALAEASAAATLTAQAAQATAEAARDTALAQVATLTDEKATLVEEKAALQEQLAALQNP